MMLRCTSEVPALSPSSSQLATAFSGPPALPPATVSYDTYIPMLRLPLATVAGGKAGGPEKAVANWDEDGLNAGTSEVQRNIIAQRVLGLPRA